MTFAIFSVRSLVAALATLAVALVAQLVWRGYRTRRFYRDLPGPPHSWLFGHLKVMGEVSAALPPNCHPQALFTEIARRYEIEGIFYIDLWPVSVGNVVLRDPKSLDQVTVLKPLHQHTMAADFLRPALGDGIIAVVNGSVWKKLHKAMSPAFSWSHIRHLTDIMVDETMVFRKSLDQLAATGEVFSLEEASSKLIFEIIARIVFNYSLNAQTKGSQDLSDLKEMIRLIEGEADIAIAYNPIEQIKRRWRRRQVLERLHPSIISKIYERLELLVREKVVPSRKDPESILDLMLRDYLQEREEKGVKMTGAAKLPAEEEALLLNNIKGLLLGGHGTTTDSICFVYMLLSKNPHIVEKMREEHRKELGDSFQRSVDSLLSAPEKLQNLTYTDAVIKETLRLFPVGYGVREATPGLTLSQNGQDFPIDNGLAITLNGHDLHYNPEYFPEPTKFMPERWLGDEEIPRSYFRTFSRGPRACLGQNLAMNEMKVFLLMTVSDYSFEFMQVSPNEKPRASWTDLDTVYGDMVFQELGIEAKPRGGMMVKVTKRA